MLPYLLIPFQPTALIFIACTAVGLELAAHAGLLGLPLALLLLSWLLKYGYVLLEAVANGARTPPVLSVEMINPVEQRPLLQLLILLLGYAAVVGVARALGTAAGSLLAALLLIALPASIGALGVSGSPWQAANPVALWRIIGALGTDYLWISAMMLLYGAALVWMESWHWSLLSIIAGCFAWLSAYSMIGGALYEARDALGFEPIDTPERRALRVQRQREIERERVFDSIYAQARGGNLAGAWHSIEREIAASSDEADLSDWLLHRLTGVPNARVALPLANRLAQLVITRSLARDDARALQTARDRLALDAEFRPRAAAETLRVAQLAQSAGDPAMAAVLMQGFEQRFPGSTPGATIGGAQHTI